MSSAINKSHDDSEKYPILKSRSHQWNKTLAISSNLSHSGKKEDDYMRSHTITPSRRQKSA